MTDILCRWLNEEVKVATKLDVTNFAREFASGLLIGEVLHKYQLLGDFDQFSQSKTAGAKLNNFTRVEPILHLLGVNFDTNIARDVMSEKHGAATRLMYQLFIAINNKEKNNLTGTAIETMRPAGPVNLENITSEIYKERLKVMMPRQTDLNLDSLVSQFHDKQLQMESKAFKERFEEEEKHIQQLQEQRQQLIQKYKVNQAQKSEMLAKIQTSSTSKGRRSSKLLSASPERAATVHIPKPPANRTAKSIALRRQATKLKEKEEVIKDIAAFEEALQRTLPPSQSNELSGELSEIEQTRKDVPNQQESLDLIRPKGNDEYINKIRKRLNEDAAARAEREKRRRKVLVDQLKAHELQEEARREEMMVNRLMRQSQQERRIAVQLLQTRHEKEIIKRNRIMREKQHEDRRLREFEDALNREAEAARLAKLNYIEQIEKDKALHNQIKEERERESYKKHYDQCMEMLLGAVDLATKIGEYRQLTNKLLPAKLMREWKALFADGQPIYDNQDDMALKKTTSEQLLEAEKDRLLNEGDFSEYRNMVGEWNPPQETGITGPPKPNAIIGHIVQRLFDIVQPPVPPPLAPDLPPFPVKVCVLGKPFAGKTSCLQKLADEHLLMLLDTETLITEAVEASKNNETVQVTGIVSSQSTSSAIREGSAPPTAESVKSGHSTATPRSSSVKAAEAEPIEQQPDNKDAEEDADANATAAATPENEEGKEKGDEEKPVDDQVKGEADEDNQTTSDEEIPPPEEQLREVPSPKAKLGAKVSKLLKRGKPVDDCLLVDIIIESIKTIPEGTGWILDGFPTTYNQAKLLEKALSGLDNEGQEKAKASMKKSLLAPNPRPKPPPSEPPSGIDMVILLNIPDDTALKRAAGRYLDQNQGEQYQLEFKPPPHGSATGIAHQEQVIPVSDRGYDQEQLQHRLTAFEDAWPRLEKWFNKFGTLRLVQAEQENQTVYLEVEKLLENIHNKEEDIQESATTEIEVIEVPQPEPEEKVPEAVPPQTAEVPAEGRPTTPAGKEKSRPPSGRSKSPTTSRPSSKRDASRKKSAGKKSREVTPSKSPKRSKSAGKGKSPELQPEPEPEVPPGTPPPAPGSEQWEFVDEPVEELDPWDPDNLEPWMRDQVKELAQVLAKQWEIVENTYTDGAKVTFKQLRDERDNIIHYFYNIRRNFEAYLRRPDHKQEFVSQWQVEYNSLEDDIRGDDETKWELHQRVDDLRERLWSICDERKEQAENEREGVIADGWLEDHLGLLTNQYLSLMQIEVDRYQDSTRMLKDYYKAMDGKIPDELQADYARLPLVELPIEDRPPSASSSQTSGKSESKTPTGSPRASRPNTPKSGTPKRKRSKHSTPTQSPVVEPEGDKDKKRIPLIPRRPSSADQSAQAKAKADKGKPGGKGSKAEGAETPQPPTDLDEKLLYDGCVAAIAAVDKILQVEQAARDAEEEAERQAQLEKEKEKAAAAGKKGGKGGKKSKSPSPKKSTKDLPATTPPPEEEVSEEEKQKKLMKEKAKVEYFAAVEEEAVAVKLRLELVKAIAMSILQHLKNQADEAYKEMNDWLGARFLKEMESIDQMSEVVRSAIEEGTRIQYELVLQGEEFVILEDVRVLRTPTPPPRPPAVEKTQEDIFTVDQLFHLFSQLSLIAPNGTLASKAFQEMFTELSALTYGTEQLPESWVNVTPEKLEQMSQEMCTNGEYIDWRAFLLAAAQPWPKPTQQQLLDCLTEFANMDQLQTGFVTRQQYDRVELWFRGTSKPPSPDDLCEAYPYDRLGNLKTAFFDIFANNTVDPPQLDYVNMLLYFCVADDAVSGFVRALSVAVGQHMPPMNKSQNDNDQPATRPASQTSNGLDPNVINDEEREVIPESALISKVPLSALHRVLHHGQSLRGDTHRFSVTADPEDTFSESRLRKVYEDLGCPDEMDGVLFNVLIEHPVIQDILSSFKIFKSMNLQQILITSPPNSDANNVQASE